MNEGQIRIEINQLEAKCGLARTDKDRDNIIKDIDFYKRQLEGY